MKRLLERAHSRETGMLFYDRIRPMSVDLSVDTTGQIRPHTLDRNEEWELTLTLKQNYWANKAQREGVEKLAMRAIAADLYRDVLEVLPALRLAITSGDRDGALALTEQLSKVADVP